MNILFRADSSSKIGTGHIMRDLVLAKQFKNDNIIFACLDLQGNINSKIVDCSYKLKILKSNDVRETIKLIKKYNIQQLVIDNYNIDYKYEKEIKDKTSAKIFVVDDTYEKHYCDILLNHNIYADKSKYEHLVPHLCEIRCGMEYTLLRDEFVQEKKKKTILLAMGGADNENNNIRILKILKQFKDIKVIVITTNANPHLNILKKYSKKNKWIKLAINSLQVAKLMKKSCFAITTPSVTLNELSFMNIPFIAIKTAKNQKEMYKYLKNNKLDVLKKFNKKSLLQLLKKYLKENI